MSPKENRALCAYCRKPHGLGPGHVNRALKGGYRLYCGRLCSGLGRRTNKTKAQKVAEKSAYDKQYRKRDPEQLKARKHAYHKRTYDPAKAALERKKKMPRHVEYCRRPEYRLKKQAYDQERRDSAYGPFAEAARLAINLNREIKGRMSRHEIYTQNQTLNKKQTRARKGHEGYGRDRHPGAQG